MGFFDKIKSIATASKCKIGVHAGEWSHIEGEPECQFEKTCPDCNKYLTKSEHEYSEWKYEDESSCDATRECSLCGDIDNDEIHLFEMVQQEDGEEEIEVCQRCGYQN